MPGQRDAREESGTGGLDAGVGGGQPGLGGADVWPLVEKFRRQAGPHHRDAERIEAAAAHLQEGGRAADQQRQRGDVLPEHLVEQRDLCALAGQQRFLLRDFEIGGGARLAPLADQRQHAVRAFDVAMRDAQPILRGQHQEVRGRDTHDRGHRDGVAIEAGGDRLFLRRARIRAVLAPEVDLVARGDCDLVPRAIRPAGLSRALNSGVEIGVGRSGAPASLLCASACTMRAIAIAMSKLAVCASSIRSVSSLERNPRHQSSGGRGSMAGALAR